MLVRPKPDPQLGWAYRPDGRTVTALARGMDKIRAHPELGHDRPHAGVKTADEPKPRRKKRGRVLRTTHRRKERQVMAKKVTSSKKKSPKRASSKKTTARVEDRMIPLKTICSQLDLDPKATRVRLRRMIEKGDIKFHDRAERWVFTPVQAKQVKEALRA